MFGRRSARGLRALTRRTTLLMLRHVTALLLPLLTAGHEGHTRASAIGQGLTLTVFNNTALAGPGRARVVDSLERLSLSSAGTDGPFSALLSGALAPSTGGKFGFELTFDPPLPFLSPIAYARLWVDDHLLYPRNTTLNPSPEAASSAPLWIPLPPRALRCEDVVDTPGGAPLANYTIRLTVVCLARTGCGPRSVTLRWASVAPDERWRAPPFVPIPPSVLVPLPPTTEQARRALAARLEQGWGTFYNPSVVTWELLPEVSSCQRCMHSWAYEL